MPTDNPFAYLLNQPERRRRKRGGLAGIWDRNKGDLGSVAGAALGNIIAPGIGTYLGGALGGAAARGRLDERALGDALTGAGGVSLGRSAGRGLSRLLNRGAEQAATTAGAATSVASNAPMPSFDPNGPTPMSRMNRGIGRVTSQQLGATDMTRAGQNFLRDSAASPLGVGAGVAGETARSSQALNSYVRGGAGRLGRGLRAVGGFVRENPEAVGMGLQAASVILGSQAERRMVNERLREERRRAQNQAIFAAPLYLEMLRERGGQ